MGEVGKDKERDRKERRLFGLAIDGGGRLLVIDGEEMQRRRELTTLVKEDE